MRAFIARRFRALTGRHSLATRHVGSGRRRAAAVANAAVSSVEQLESRQLMSTYYVSPWGSDWNAARISAAPISSSATDATRTRSYFAV